MYQTGIDSQALADFEANPANNLYKLWNRLASGSYHPSPVKQVEIPTDNGDTPPWNTHCDRSYCTNSRELLLCLV